MPMDHYHVMSKEELGPPGKLEGKIYYSLLDAAYEYWLRVRKETPIKVTERAINAHGRGKFLRARRGDGQPYVYLAICGLYACDLTRLRYRGLTIHQGRTFDQEPEPQLGITSRTNSKISGQHE